MFHKKRLAKNERGFYTGGWNIFTHYLDLYVYIYIADMLLTCQKLYILAKKRLRYCKVKKDWVFKEFFLHRSTRVIQRGIYLYTWLWFLWWKYYKSSWTSYTDFLQINILMANGDKKTIRKNVTERMYSVRVPPNWLSVLLVLKLKVIWSSVLFYFDFFSLLGTEERD